MNDKILDITRKRARCFKAIKNAKDELNKTDYKVIKCMEAQLSNTEMPYDKDELIQHRNELRDIINNSEVESQKLRTELVKLMKQENNNEPVS